MIGCVLLELSLTPMNFTNPSKQSHYTTANLTTETSNLVYEGSGDWANVVINCSEKEKEVTVYALLIL